jgi:ribosome-associated protein
MLEVNQHIRIPLEEFTWSYVRAGGPGGQNVNKVASKAVLRWPVAASPSLPDDVKARLRAQQARRVTGEGELVISSQRFRDQDRNRQDCLDKVKDMVLQAAAVPKARKKTKPSRGAKEARLREKKRRSGVKAERRGRFGD